MRAFLLASATAATLGPRSSLSRLTHKLRRYLLRSAVRTAARALGSFKVRGGLVYVDDLLRRGPAPLGIIAATRSNHGQSIAFAARRYGLRATVVVPHGNSLEKNAAMCAFGAELIEHGRDFQDTFEYASQVARERNLVMVPTFHELLVRGVATYGLEFLRAVNTLDTVYVPIGLGSGLCGTIAAPLGLLAVHACRAAIVDAGLDAGQIDGLATYPESPFAGAGNRDGEDVVSVNWMMNHLARAPDLKWYAQIETGMIASPIIEAVNALIAGACAYVLVWRALHRPRPRAIGGGAGHGGAPRAARVSEISCL
jgi:hypothetical protein